MDVYNDDSDDVEVFDGNPNDVTAATSSSHFEHTLPATATATGRTGSSSSSRKSSYDDTLQEKSIPTEEIPIHLPPLLPTMPTAVNKPHNGSPASSLTRPTVVEWRPEESQSDENSLPRTPQDEEDENLGAVRRGAGKDEEEEEEDEMVEAEEVMSSKEEDEFMNEVYSSTVTVTIDAPRDGDQGDEDDPVTRYLGGSVDPRINFNSGESEEKRGCDRSGDGGGGTVECDGGGLWKMFGGDEEGDQGEEDGDLYECLNDVDMSDEEDCDSPPPIRLCLLSRYSVALQMYFSQLTLCIPHKLIIPTCVYIFIPLSFFFSCPLLSLQAVLLHLVFPQWSPTSAPAAISWHQLARGTEEATPVRPRPSTTECSLQEMEQAWAEGSAEQV